MENGEYEKAARLLTVFANELYDFYTKIMKLRLSLEEVEKKAKGKTGP